MPIRVAIVGPGRVGMALGLRLRQAKVEILGYAGRSEASAARACAFVGQGRPLSLAEVGQAHVVMFSVSDPQLAVAVRAAAEAAPPRSCSLWLHTSARFDLSVFEPLATKGVRIGALHPMAPFPDAATAARSLAGKPAALIADPRAKRLVLTLVERLGMVALWFHPGGNRAMYHAACALAANGLTALRGIVDAAFVHSGSLSERDAALAADALMRAALDACRELGPTAALSGPVLRGDVETVLAHRRELRAADPALDAAYSAIMSAALPLAALRGLDSASQSAVARALEAKER